VFGIEYTIVRIDDQPIPLAASPGTEFLPVVIAVMLLVVLLCGLIGYLSACQKLRSRIRKLGEDETPYCGWKYCRLKETVAQLEMQRTEPMVDEIVETLKKNKINEPF